MSDWTFTKILDANGEPTIYVDLESRGGWQVIALGPSHHASSEE